MGAEGGINWVVIDGGKKEYNEFSKLIEPFFYFCTVDKKSWNNWNVDIFDPPKNSFITTYGSFQEFDGIFELKYLLDEIRSFLYYKKRKPNFVEMYEPIRLDYTFFEVAEDVLTRPYWYQDNVVDKTVKNIGLVECFQNPKGMLNKNYINRYKTTLNIKIGDWIGRIEKLIINNFSRYETWT